jgi:hypothetical protein
LRVLDAALARHGKPEIFNSDLGSQSTSLAFTERPKADYAAMSASKNAPRWIKHVKLIGKWPAPKTAPATANA